MKKLLSMALAIALALTLIPASAFAATSYGVWVGNTEVTSANKKGEGWSYNNSTKTLTLNGAKITKTHPGSRYSWEDFEYNNGIYSEHDLNLTLQGTNSISSTSQKRYYAGINVQGQLTISGSGSLQIGGKVDEVEPNCGISATSIVMESSSISCTMPGQYGIGLLGESDILLKGGSVKVTDTNSGVQASTFSASGGDMLLEGITYAGIEVGKTFTLSGGNISIDTAETENVCFGIHTEMGNINVKKGNLSIDMAKVPKGLEVFVRPFRRGEAVAICSEEGAVKISGGSVDIQQAKGSVRTRGIYATNVTISGGVTTISSGSAKQFCVGIFSIEKLLISGGTTIVKAAGTSSDSETIAMDCYSDEKDAFAITGGSILAVGNTSAFSVAPTTSKYADAVIMGSKKIDGSSIAKVKLTSKNVSSYKYVIISETGVVSPKATATNAAKGVRVDWDQVAGATGYKVYRKTGTGSYKLLTTIKDKATLTYTDTSAKNGTEYVYAVRAVNGNGTSKTGPSVAKLFLSRAEISSAKNSSAGKVTVKWGKNGQADGYEIKYTTGSTTKTVTVNNSDTASKTISSLTKGKTYSVSVRAYKTSGFQTYYGSWSAAKTVKISK